MPEDVIEVQVQWIAHWTRVEPLGVQKPRSRTSYSHYTGFARSRNLTEHEARSKLEALGLVKGGPKKMPDWLPENHDVLYGVTRKLIEDPDQWIVVSDPLPHPYPNPQ